MSVSYVYQSALAPAIRAHIGLKRALGRRYDREAWILRDLDRFLERRSADDLNAAEFSAWALELQRLQPASRRQYLRVARTFCQYRRRGDPRCFVPDPSSFPKAPPPRPAHIFPPAQVSALLQAAARMPALRQSPLQPRVYRLATALAYAAGLRRGELVRLAIGDCDLQERTLLLRESKGGRSRLVALSGSAAGEVRTYLEHRRRFPHTAASALLAHGPRGERAYTGRGIDLGFRRLFRAAGIRTASGLPPRLHDLRHTHAVHVLLHWYRAGGDPQAGLPALAASMGHVSLASTAYYLAPLEAVLDEAFGRFARFARPGVGREEEAGHA